MTGRWWWLWGVVLAVGCDGDPEPLGPALQPRAETQTCMVDVGEPPEPPMWLSETGCFDSLPERVPGPDLIPYTVNSPLWTDGALKERYIVVPPDQFVTFTEVGPWELPVGSVIVKNFVLPPGTRGSDVDVPMETRFMIRGEKEWAFFTYEWNEDRTDAKRFDLGGLRRVPLTGDALLDGGVDGGGSDGDDVLLYQIPDRSSCATCHGEAPAAVLGVATRQLNGPGNYGRNRTNQIDAMDAIGLFGDTRGPKALAELPRLAGPTDKNASLEERARSYLDTHCAACHQPGGWTSPEITFDLRVETPFAETQLCGERALFPYPANTGDYRIDPGRPDNSNLLGRLSVEGVGEVGEMPPLGRSTVDPVGTALIRDWIRSLEGCPEPDQ